MKFQEWIASYAGCDGGNPNKSSIWFVGIEWGFAKENGQSDIDHDKAVTEYHNGSMLESISQGYSEPYADSYPLKDHLHYTFGRNSTKLITAIKGHPVGSYQDVAVSTNESDIFKLNLYPIGLPTVDDQLWDKFNLETITGLPTKQSYRDICAKYRFPFFRSELTKHSPNLILCTGTTYVDQFAKCFCDIDDISDLNREEIVDSSPTNNKPRSLYWKWINDNTLFATVPFVTNPSGLNSHSILQEFGDRIKSIMLSRESSCNR